MPIKPTVASGRRARAASSIPRPARNTGTRQTGRAISSTSISARGVLMRAAFVGITLAASATMIRESSGMGVSASRKTFSFWRTRGPSTTRRFFASGIEWIGLRQCRNPFLQSLRLASRGPGDHLRYLAHLFLAHPARGHRRRSEADTARYRRRLGIVGDHVLVARDPHGIQLLF